MEKDKPLSLNADPFSVWADVAMKTCEMMAASAEVISHRAGRMAVAGPIPNAIDQYEFALMGREKIEAAAESARAMAEFVMTMNRQLGAQAFSQMLTGSTAMISLVNTGKSMAMVSPDLVISEMVIFDGQLAPVDVTLWLSRTADMPLFFDALPYPPGDAVVVQGGTSFGPK